MHNINLKIETKIQEAENKRNYFIERYGYIKPPNVIKSFDNNVYSVLEGKIHIHKCEQSSCNFADVIRDHALLFFGDDLTIEENKPFQERHPAIQWFHLSSKNHNTQAQKGLSENEIEDIGISGAWLRFCNDLYTVRDNTKMKVSFKNRLLNQNTFQAARHELYVAALCIAAGFTIEYEDDTDSSRTHVEFIATDRFSQLRIAVEAKLRQRNNVMGFIGGRHELLGSSVDIKNPVQNAYRKQKDLPPDLPLYVFVDVNLPSVKDNLQLQTWLSEIGYTMNELKDKGYADPCPANAIFFTNDPSHHIMDRPLIDETDELWIHYWH